MAQKNDLIPFKYIIRSPVTSLCFDEQMFLILKWARKRESRIVCLANVHMIMEAHKNLEFAEILESADLVSPDGTPLVWMLQKMGTYEQNRVAGMDVFQRLCELCFLADISIFFLGSETEILGKMKEKLKTDFPNLIIAGMESLPFRPLTVEEDQQIIEKINASKAGIVFISLGCPKQEYFMRKHYQKINAVMIGVGAVFPIYAGLYKRAPKYVRDFGCEWLYRFLQEPQRLWKRYLTTIPAFIVLAIIQLTKENKAFLSSGKSVNLEDIIYSNSPVRLGEFLVRQNVISEQQLETALQEQQELQKKLGEILVTRKILTLPELNYYLQNQNFKFEEFLLYKKIAKQKVINKFKFFDQIILTKFIDSYININLLLQELLMRKNGYWLAPYTNQDSYPE